MKMEAEEPPKGENYRYFDALGVHRPNTRLSADGREAWSPRGCAPRTAEQRLLFLCRRGARRSARLHRASARALPVQCI